jgi:hypothetical protein
MAETTERADLATQYLFGSDRFSLESTDQRVHDRAMERWCYKRFLLREGCPCPVIMAPPMDAYAQFRNMWKQPNNPYNYLKTQREYGGLEPTPMRFPLISLEWKRMRYRPEQSYASRTNRRLYYPTISPDVKLRDLASVAQARFPAAWTYVYQMDFWCARRDTQASFVQQLTNSFRVMSAGTPQTFIPAVFPGYFGGVAERLVLASDIENMTEAESTEKELQHRISVTLELEGYAVDPTVTVAPVLWEFLLGANVLSPEDTTRYFDMHGVETSFDLRTLPLLNATLVHRHLPPTE